MDNDELYATLDGLVEPYWFANVEYRSGIPYVHPIDSRHLANCVITETGKKLAIFVLFGFVKLRVKTPICSGEYIVSGDNGQPYRSKTYPDRPLLAQALESSTIGDSVILAKLL